MTWKRKVMRLFYLGAVVCLVGTLSVSSAAAAKVRWESYDEGIARGKKEQKKILVKFHADWCTYCKEMERTTFSDPEIVAYINRYFVPVSVDTDKQKGLAVRYRVNSLPASWFLDYKGEQILPVPGYVPPKMYLYFLEWIAEDGYKDTSLKDFLKNKKE